MNPNEVSTVLTAFFANFIIAPALMITAFLIFFRPGKSVGENIGSSFKIMGRFWLGIFQFIFSIFSSKKDRG